MDSRPTPTLTVMHDKDNDRYLVMRGGVLIADCGKGSVAKLEVERITLAVNAYEKDQAIKKELIKTLKTLRQKYIDALGGIGGEGIILGMVDGVITKAEGK